MAQGAAAASTYIDADARVFFDILTHDDRNSNYVLACKGPSGWNESIVHAGDYRKLANFDRTCSYYLTRNGFIGRERKLEHLRQVNALMFDIDCHEKGGEALVPSLIKALGDAYEDEVLPRPNLLVDTGRGIQAYYVLDRSTAATKRDGSRNAKGLGWVRGIQTGLAEAYKPVIALVKGAELDPSVFDFSRVSRIPGSFNPVAQRGCSLLWSSTSYWTLKDLGKWCSSKPEKVKQQRLTPLHFNRTQMRRLKNIEDLQALRGFGCEGARENMNFVFYNTATQIYGPDRAFEMLRAFDLKFNHPLGQAVCAQIRRTVDAVTVVYGPQAGMKGFYPLSAATVADKLFLTSQEAAAIGFCSTAKEEKRAAAKAATKAKKAARDKEIVKLYTEQGMTQASIAEKVGVCLRTVATVIARAGAKRGIKETLDTLAMAQKYLTKKADDEHAKSCPTSWDCVQNSFLAAPPALPSSSFFESTASLHEFEGPSPGFGT